MILQDHRQDGCTKDVPCRNHTDVVVPVDDDGRAGLRNLKYLLPTVPGGGSTAAVVAVAVAVEKEQVEVGVMILIDKSDIDNRQCRRCHRTFQTNPLSEAKHHI